MSMFTAIERLAHPIGIDIGRTDSRTQADLLNGLFHGMSTVAPLGAPGDDMQSAYIADELSAEAKRWIVLLAQFCAEEK